MTFDLYIYIKIIRVSFFYYHICMFSEARKSSNEILPSQFASTTPKYASTISSGTSSPKAAFNRPPNLFFYIYPSLFISTCSNADLRDSSSIKGMFYLIYYILFKKFIALITY